MKKPKLTDWEKYRATFAPVATSADAVIRSAKPPVQPVKEKKVSEKVQVEQPKKRLKVVKVGLLETGEGRVFNGWHELFAEEIKAEKKKRLKASRSRRYI